MNNNFSVKNFRSYGETGASFKIAPITVLTGCNSSGKSSLVKAQLLLSDVLKQIKEKKSLYGIELRVSDKDLQLGRFDKVLNKFSNSGTIVFEYETMSYLLAEKIRVKMSFVESKDSLINNGLLSEVLIEKLDGSLIYNAKDLNETKKKPSLHKRCREYNLFNILDNFKRFMLFQLVESIFSYYDYGNEYGYKIDPIQVRLSDDFISEKWKNTEKYIQEYFGDESTKSHYVDCFRNTSTNIGEVDSEAIENWLRSGTMYYWLPIFEDLNGREKSYLRSYLINKLNISDENYVAWINYFADDFESSEYNTFLEYFRALEFTSMKNGLFIRPEYSAPRFHDIIYKNRYILIDSVGSTMIDKDYKLSRNDYEEELNFGSVVSMLLYIYFGYGEFIFGGGRGDIPKDSYYLFKTFNKYAETIIKEAISPSFLENIKYIDSSSVKIHRLYSTEEKDKIATNLKQFIKVARTKELENENTYREEYLYDLLRHKNVDDELMQALNEVKHDDRIFYEKGTFINRWIKNFGIGDSIEIKGTEEGLGVLVYLNKDGETKLLADEGYGITQLFSLLLQIENSILNATQKVYKVGPWTTEFNTQIKIGYNPSTIYVEEPENHLHPKFQSLLADMFLEAYQKYNIHFVVETHSEYLIRKLQLHVANKEVDFSREDLSLNYVDTDEQGFAFNKQIEVQEDGRLKESFGSGFFDEADKLAVELIMFKAQVK